MAEVIAVQQGTILAHDARAFRSWLRDNEDPADRARGLTGEELEQAVLAVAALDPFAHDPRSRIVEVVN